ncbi:MAG TPA: response regulator [Candidatus Eisenbacteria bacterium]|nr:response regulator [Candidatus Eisenbacteria bacterium]
MKDVVSFLQNLDALAFVLLGVATAVGWTRRRDRSLLWLALAIILLSFVSLLGRVPALLHVTLPLVPEVSLVAFMGSGYALLRYRASLIPLSPRWHNAAVVAMAGGSLVFLAAQYLATSDTARASLLTAAGIALVLIWSAAVVEPIVRFWLVARGLPAVQAWRLRSLSLGFAGLVAILLFAVGAGAAARSQLVQIAIQVVVLLIVPLLYVSFSPPAWLRREWRASEEEGLRAFMQDLLLLHEERISLAERALEWAMRITGGASAVAFAPDGSVLAARGLDRQQVEEVHSRIAKVLPGVNRISLRGEDATVLALPIGRPGDAGHLAVLAGPFTPGFGGDEISRVQQFMTAVAAALERAQLLERLKEANTKLVEANKHKSVFLASMSHELRTPLNAILGFSELLLDSPADQIAAPTKKRFLEQIHSSGKHLLGLINDILDLSKIEAGQMELRLQTVSVGAVVQEVISTIEPLAAQKQIRVEADAGSAGEIQADQGKFKQMLLNLVSNAIKFTPPGGTVKITALRLQSAVELTVADTGIGIAQSDQARIFHELQQVDSGTGRQQTGTGLGLSLTQRFAALHKGNVRVQSELGKGSVFTLHMPLVAAQGERLRAGGDVAPHNNGNASLPLILVVEDDPAAAELLARQLDRAGFRSEIVSAGSEVVAKARALKPAAITLDVLLPDLDGWEVLNRLKNDEATCMIPVIVISVVDNPELGTALGALDYFVKPVAAQDLIARLGKFTFTTKVKSREVRVLVVDDESANRDWLAGILEPAGFGVISASGGAEAIELARSRKPDLVLLDLLMPEVTGFDVVEALRSDEATRQIPIMVLTSKDLTKADKRHLNGQVSTILRRGSTGATDLLVLLRDVIANRAAEAGEK